MRKIIITISVLVIAVFAAVWLYFSNISASESTTEKAFNAIPADASLIFEYKNESSYYDIFKDFTLFKDVLGEDIMKHLTALKNTFIDDAGFNEALFASELYFSIHQTSKNQADVLIIAPLKNKQLELSQEGINNLKQKFKVTEKLLDKTTLYTLTFNNQSKFYFTLAKTVWIGSFNENLVQKAVLESSNKKQKFFKGESFSSVRNKNAIANLYINYPNLASFLAGFSKKDKPAETENLKTFPAFSSLNINYQKNAFMFSGITELEQKGSYPALFLKQQSGKCTLLDLVPFDAASYLFYLVSNQQTFQNDLNTLFEKRKEIGKRKSQLQNISETHSINIEKEFPVVLGKEFGCIQVASGNKIGIIKTTNTGRLSFILSTISTSINSKISRFDDSDLLYYHLGDPFKGFRRPYYAIIENHLLVSNNMQALNGFLKNYEEQDFLSRTDKNLQFQQYLSNQGNIFYFLHNSNAKAVVKSYLSSKANKQFKGEEFGWKNVYGISIQFSADKDKFFTNLYMSKVPELEDVNPQADSLLLDSLLK
ncbi:hypothetical protein FYC62_08535 [Pedobacter aquae]|uniref:DUF3352 domain-containing protein n=1 Tax=Pedobacter aquae TaxID=2605747 RepID=A0A5C0VKM4_9SPHI|nr:hypothetical protein [Pedobacter aquae]QEK51700.1 hypothetical protein FYC62_08535 [Pedobacter aquae]